MPTSTLKLQTNIPLTGFVRYANYWKGKPWTDDKGVSKILPDQIQLKGSWDGSTDEGLFLPVSLVGQMLDMGLLRQEQQPDERGNPKYTVMNGTRKVRVLKTEDGKKKPIYISWADAPATAAAPAAAPQQAPPPPPERKKSPEQRAAPTGPANGDAVKLEQLRKAHRKALNTIGETQANAWRSAKHQIDILLSEWSIERTKIPTHVYLDLIARFGASSGIEAFKQNLVVEHKTRAAAESPRPGVAAQAAVPLKPIDAEPPALAPVARHEDEHGRDDGEPAERVPGPTENTDFWPEEEDDLPF